MLDHFPHNKAGRALKKIAGRLPLDFVHKLPLIYSQESDLAQVVESLKNLKPTTLRVNTLKSNRQTIEDILTKNEITFDSVPWYPDAFIIPNTFSKKITNLDAFNQGLYYVQSLSSMIPALILNPQPTDAILDMCAAPGSKTTQIAALMNNGGQIIANDLSRVRTYRLQGNLNIQGVSNTRVLLGPGQFIWKRMPDSFDKVLLDAPCSLEGRFNIIDPDSYRQWSTREVKKNSERQKFLLRSAISCAKPGGEIVYSTCTSSPEENEAVIDWTMKKEAHRLEVLPIELPNLPLAPALVGWKEKTFHPSVALTKRITPNPHHEGFYIARIKKRV